MLLNSNSDNSNFLLSETFFSVLWPKKALVNSNFSTFTLTYGKKIEDKYLIFTLIVVKYLLVFLTNFASPEKWSMQGICSSSPSPKFTLLPVSYVVRKSVEKKKTLSKILLLQGIKKLVSAWDVLLMQTIVNCFQNSGISTESQ